jgi:hypothetical protein
MTARSRARWGSAVIAAVAGTCLALTGCSSSPSSTPTSTGLPSGAVTVPPTPQAGSASPTVGKLTGNFCNDFRNIGTNFQLPASAQGSVSAAQHQGVQYLNKLEAYFNGLAAEAPAKVAKDLRTIAADFQATASAITSKSLSSLTKIEQQVQNLTTNGASGTAFRNLIAYLVTKCGATGSGIG